MRLTRSRLNLANTTGSTGMDKTPQAQYEGRASCLSWHLLCPMQLRQVFKAGEKRPQENVQTAKRPQETTRARPSQWATRTFTLVADAAHSSYKELGADRDLVGSLLLMPACSTNSTTKNIKNGQWV